MIAQAFAMQEACRDAVLDQSTAMLANVVIEADTRDERNSALIQFAMHLSSLTAAMVAEAVLTEEQKTEMLTTIEMLQAMGDGVAEGDC